MKWTYPALLLLFTLLVTLPPKLDKAARNYGLEVEMNSIIIDQEFRYLSNQIQAQNRILAMVDSALKDGAYHKRLDDIYHRKP